MADRISQPARIRSIQGGVVEVGCVRRVHFEHQADDRRRSEEGETLKAQERIGAKVFDSGRGPIKFPEPKGSVHMIMVDARGFLGNGRGDKADWRQIAFGPHGLDPRLIKYWTSPTTGERAPIMGLFQSDCPLRAAPTLQARVHFVGFVCERTFLPGEIKQQVYYASNPVVFADEDAAKSAIMRWPLRSDGC
jgi:hypothetical protein